MGIAALIVLFLNRRHVRDLQQAQEPAAKRHGGTFEFLRSPTVWFCFAFFFIVTLAFGALQNYSAPIFERVYGVSIPMAASALTAYLLGKRRGHRDRRILRRAG